MEDRAVKYAGYPRVATKDAFNNVQGSFTALFEVLLRRLLGLSPTELRSAPFDQEARETGRNEEIEAVQSVFPASRFDSDSSILSVPLGTAPATFNIMYAADHPYPESARLPPYYISSTALPPYVRLHLTAEIARALFPNGERSEGEGICFDAIEAAESAWNKIEVDGPPKIEDVLYYLLPPRAVDSKVVAPPLTGKTRPSARVHRGDTRSNVQILREFENLRSQKAYKIMEEQRSHLPAWASQAAIVKMIQDNQVIIVVGETGEIACYWSEHGH